MNQLINSLVQISYALNANHRPEKPIHFTIKVDRLVFERFSKEYLDWTKTFTMIKVQGYDQPLTSLTIMLPGGSATVTISYD
jgi:hypothetical protein